MQRGCPGLCRDQGCMGFEGAWKNPLPCPLLPAPGKPELSAVALSLDFCSLFRTNLADSQRVDMGWQVADKDGAGAPWAGRMAVTPSPDRNVLGLPKAVSEFCVWTLLTQVLAEVDDGELLKDWNGKPTGTARGCLLCVASG